jgi:DNA gyrase subunit A
MENSIAKEIQKVSVEAELKKSYLDYAMSVIIGRALPDVRDGLKPVHRRVLYAMHELSNDYNKPYKKSARIVGDVIGKYHPHGDTPVYDTIVRMAQPFSMRYVLIDGQGNFGSIDGDAAAAMRYTEIRMAKLTHAMLADIEKDTVDFVPNYDETEFCPCVLPTRIPNLLVNGSSGIAVGMATNIPPHNLSEIIQACITLIDKPDLSLDEIFAIVPGPDFPTYGLIQGRNGIREAYHTGRGRVVMRAKTHVEQDDKHGKERIIVTELPYQVNKAKLVERIAELVKEKRLEGVTALRDESDKQGMRVVIEVRRGSNTEVLLNNLFAHTNLQSIFNYNMVALENGQPKVLNIKQLLQAFIRHRQEVVTRRSIFDLRKARERVHILEGLAIALANIDPMIALIKKAKDSAEAKAQLLEKTWHAANTIDILSRVGEIDNITHLTELYGLTDQGYKLSPIQAQAILEMRLNRLTGLEQDKIVSEHKELQHLIASLNEILQNPKQLMQVIRDELLQVQKDFGDARRTQIIETDETEVVLEDLIPDNEMVVTLSHEGYVKTQPLEVYQAQHRGGRGKAATSMKDEDFVEFLIAARMRDTVLCFTNFGKVYPLKVHQLPQAARTARGKPIVNVLNLAEKEKVNAFLAVREFSENHYVVMVTSQGVVKKVSLANFAKLRVNGAIVINFKTDEDYLVQADITNGEQELLIFSDDGKCVRFNEKVVRCMGKTAAGVRAMRLKEGQKVVSLIVSREGDILTATENGYGKRTLLEAYRLTSRGGQGVISIQVSERNGKVVGALQVMAEDEIMLISNKGTLVRVPVAEISVVGRGAQGVRLINLGEGESLVSLERIATMKGEDKE